MSKIVPTIFASDLETFKKQIKQMEAVTDYIQIDVCDGIFVPQKTVSAEEVKTVSTFLSVELHLMVADPRSEIEKWYDLPNLKRIFFHLEAAKTPLAFTANVSHIESYGWSAGIAVNPETPIEEVNEAAYDADVLLFMAVHPGKQGQAFIPETLERIKFIRAEHPHLPIAVDGGIHEAEIARLKELGVEYLDVGSEIFTSTDPAAKFKELKAWGLRL